VEVLDIITVNEMRAKFHLLETRELVVEMMIDMVVEITATVIKIAIVFPKLTTETREIRKNNNLSIETKKSIKIKMKTINRFKVVKLMLNNKLSNKKIKSKLIRFNNNKSNSLFKLKEVKKM